ncbi:helix-turn-helix domain-containing protein [Myxococcota bacterium]|nr:helix-turn-helix domain-containing protein [Myxococcota bacterium]
MEQLEPLGDNVRRLRKLRGMTLREMADRSGLSQRFVSDLEHGKGNISIGNLLEVARVLETPLSELVRPLDEAADARSGRGDEERHPRIALVGLRGAGKSTIGKRTADKLGVPFLELDQEIEKSAGMPLQQIFEIYGDTYFRRLERDVLAQILKRTEEDGVVIATGGGIVMDAESWQLLKRSTRTIWLKAKPEDHYRRVMAQGDTRPMKNRPAAMSELRALLTSRAPLYAEADTTVDTSALGIPGAIEKICAVASAA